jgi:hypothetical protein
VTGERRRNNTKTGRTKEMEKRETERQQNQGTERKTKGVRKERKGITHHHNNN